MHSRAMTLSSFLFFVCAFLAVGSEVHADDFITCNSDSGRYQYCRIGGPFAAVRLNRQNSDQACNEGSSWGSDQYGVWVNHGCRAEFRVIRPQQQQQQQVRETCPPGNRPGRCQDWERPRCKDFRMPGGLGCRTN